MTVTGSCLCGRVRYRIDGPLSPVVACHCSQCRKASGHHVAATTVLRDDLLIEGEQCWFASSAGAQRGFCPVCGSNMFWDGGQDYLAVFAGTLDGDPGIRMAAHVFCADKGAYYEITDGLPQAPGLSEDIA
ncbi:GFA family protein [Rhodovulum sulfidophilum]|uniref:GFA family protein n=1 Tax=Rhodovulum sulfidophilum TaxID=35806 RepID=UPI0019240FBA|nr:GFA family protein [Rhodovulum sulfidophilum]MBL3573217.1 GFA family protein [Rhodovulum sulfidophilum]MCE8430896.1 GFA family protein [Rhodovulum sulfidophilum]MCF4115869.1 GFA family protein [Rhodovulum sulfidophilum]